MKSVEPITERIIETHRLRIIARAGVGYGNIDVRAATRRRIWVTIAPMNSIAVAKQTIALMLTLSRKILLLDRHVGRGSWYRSLSTPRELMGTELWGKILGIIGLGSMRILYYDIARRKDLEEELGIEFRSLEDILRETPCNLIILKPKHNHQ